MKIETTVKERVEHALEICRPYLQADGGDIQLVNIKDNGVVELRYEGTCVICPLSPLTLRAGIERTVLHWAPEVKRVECVKFINY
ncbi:MAG: NifU family protein [Bacteroidetes bacterium]|nr:MAG: NifU family protein [Bacteroidota bacterium]